MSLRRLGSRADVLSATSAHPYTRFATGHATQLQGVSDDDATLWINDSPFGVLGHGLGSLERLIELVEASANLVAPARWISLPRHEPGQEPSGYVHHEHWDTRWSVTAPPPQPGEDRVEALTDADADEINALLDLAMPDTPVRPGQPVVRRFYGIREAGHLVACGADRSSPLEHGPGDSVGVLGAIAVHPDHRRQGLGAAVTARITRTLSDAHTLVVLGQWGGNDAATQLYPRLGYTGVLHLTSVRCA